MQGCKVILSYFSVASMQQSDPSNVTEQLVSSAVIIHGTVWHRKLWNNLYVGYSIKSPSATAKVGYYTHDFEYAKMVAESIQVYNGQFLRSE